MGDKIGKFRSVPEVREQVYYLKWSGKVFIGLTNLALSLLNLMRRENDSIKETAEDVRYEPEKGLRAIG